MTEDEREQGNLGLNATFAARKMPREPEEEEHQEEQAPPNGERAVRRGPRVQSGVAPHPRPPGRSPS